MFSYVASFLFQSQIVVLAAQISWSEDVESALHSIANVGDNNLKPLEEVLTAVESTLNVLADSVLQEQPPLRRKKLEHLVSYKFFFSIFFMGTWNYIELL